jgi:hypothetical protein
MKKRLLIPVLLAVLVLSNCKLNVLDDPYGITPDTAPANTGPLFFLAGAMKSGFEGHNQMCWTSGLIGTQELSYIAAAISQTPQRIQDEGVPAADLGQNASQANLVYTAFNLAEKSRLMIEKGSYTAPTKALFLANIAMLEGILYGDWSKFYEKGYQFGSGKEMSPAETRDFAISRLNEAITQFNTYNNGTDFGTAATTGLFKDKDLAIKFCNSFIGMLYFDTGEKGKAASFLQKGYVIGDLGKELGYKNSNALTANGDGIFSAVVSGASFQLNQYSPAFRAGAFPLDTFRRFPSNWQSAQISQADNQNKVNYFYPAAPGTGTIPATSRITHYPIMSVAEVALMLADPAVTTGITAAQQQVVYASVMQQSWKMPAAVATTYAADPATTLERVARYEYAGRGRRWAAVSGNKKWPLPVEFSFR